MLCSFSSGGVTAWMTGSKRQFFRVRPECFVAAARSLPGRGGSTRVHSAACSIYRPARAVPGRTVRNNSRSWDADSRDRWSWRAWPAGDEMQGTDAIGLLVGGDAVRPISVEIFCAGSCGRPGPATPPYPPAKNPWHGLRALGPTAPRNVFLGSSLKQMAHRWRQVFRGECGVVV